MVLVAIVVLSLLPVRFISNIKAWGREEEVGREGIDSHEGSRERDEIVSLEEGWLSMLVLDERKDAERKEEELALVADPGRGSTRGNTVS